MQLAKFLILKSRAEHFTWQEDVDYKYCIPNLRAGGKEGLTELGRILTKERGGTWPSLASCGRWVGTSPSHPCCRENKALPWLYMEY